MNTDASSSETHDEPDALEGLGGDGTATATDSPEPFEVTIDGVMTGEKPGSKPLMVGADPRFTFHMQIDTIEPETRWLVPGLYDVVIHSPVRTFSSPVPKKGTHVRFRLTIYPDADPEQEPFFATLSVD